MGIPFAVHGHGALLPKENAYKVQKQLDVQNADRQQKSERWSEMNGVQLKMARAALGLTVREAAETSGVSHDTIVRIEAGQTLKESTIEKVRSALEAAGVEFIAENGSGPGVRLRKERPV